MHVLSMSMKKSHTHTNEHQHRHRHQQRQRQRQRHLKIFYLFFKIATLYPLRFEKSMIFRIWCEFAPPLSRRRPETSGVREGPPSHWGVAVMSPQNGQFSHFPFCNFCTLAALASLASLAFFRSKLFLLVLGQFCNFCKPTELASLAAQQITWITGWTQANVNAS